MTARHAFPMGNPEQGGNDGMTLHDYYAGQALAGICANPVFFGAVFQGNPVAAADFARAAADAMFSAGDF